MFAFKISNPNYIGILMTSFFLFAFISVCQKCQPLLSHSQFFTHMLDPFPLLLFPAAATTTTNRKSPKILIIAKFYAWIEIIEPNRTHAHAHTSKSSEIFIIYNIQIKIAHVWWRVCVVFWLWCCWKYREHIYGLGAWGINGDNMWLHDACKTYRKIYAPNHFRDT